VGREDVKRIIIKKAGGSIQKKKKKTRRAGSTHLERKVSGRGGVSGRDGGQRNVIINEQQRFQRL